MWNEALNTPSDGHIFGSVGRLCMISPEHSQRKLHFKVSGSAVWSKALNTPSDGHIFGISGLAVYDKP